MRMDTKPKAAVCNFQDARSLRDWHQEKAIYHREESNRLSNTVAVTGDPRNHTLYATSLNKAIMHESAVRILDESMRLMEDSRRALAYN